MGKCRFDLSMDCHNKDCLDCMLDKIRAEIENDWQLKEYPSSPFSCGLRMALKIIDKYRTGK